ncbi:MAG: nicotinate-nucleotide adenylyltransferase [Acidobacteriia bacterium]|nr:nicotinate-nucleotide adenylyltransferase [Terriglobia bacterium]
MTSPAEGRLPSVGVLGGTFDPVHAGHLHAAEEALRVFALPRVLLIPCATPPHKSRPDVTPAEHRLAMLRRAVEGREGLEVSTIEIVRGGVSFTLDTLRSLASGPAPVRPILILGMDALRELGTWYRHGDLLREFDLIAVDRPPGRAAAEERAAGELPPELMAHAVAVPCEAGAGAAADGGRAATGGRIYRVAIPPLPVSSSRVRTLAAAGENLAGLVPAAVARYIQDQGLYRKEARR